MELKNVDYKAIEDHSDGYLLDCGVKLFNSGKFKEATEYYRLSASLGNAVAICNLAYCYLNGAGIERNVSIAKGYFTMAFKMGDVKAGEELGNIYYYGNDCEIDKSIAVYYYLYCLNKINQDKLNTVDFPELFYVLGKETMEDGIMETNLYDSYNFLLNAEEGFNNLLEMGVEAVEEKYDEVCKLLDSKKFNDVRKEIEEENEEEDDDDCCDGHCHCKKD